MIAATPRYPVAGSKKLEAGYDYQGRRVQKKIYTYTAGSWVLEATKTFTYDGWNVITEQTVNSGQTTTEYYVWGLDLSGTLHGAGGIGGLLLWKNDRGSFLYAYDANGNVGQLVNAATGSIAARYEYDPFGNTLVADGPEAQNNPYRYSTKPYDAETGLYYYIFRYYSPKLGRWWTRDPIHEVGFRDSHFLNAEELLWDAISLYHYVNSDPINRIDYLGLKRPTTCPAEKIRFFDSYCDVVKTLAAQLRVHEDFVWTLAIKEGGWNDEGLDHNLPLHNPFGVNKTENGKAVGNKNYPSFEAAIDDWMIQGRGTDGKGIAWSERVMDSQTVDEFINNLQCNGSKITNDPRPCSKYNSWNPNYIPEYKGRYEDLQYYKKICACAVNCAFMISNPGDPP